MGTSVGGKRTGRWRERAFSKAIAPVFAAILLLMSAPDRAEADIKGDAQKSPNTVEQKTPAHPPTAADTSAAYVSAVAAPATYSLTVNRLPTAGGTATAKQQLGITTETPINITASPASDYVFVNWTVTSGLARFADANAHITTVSLSSDAAITANFQQTFSLTINRNPIEGGTVSQAFQSGITAGAPVEITATPASGYRFVNWTVTGGQAWFANSNAPKTTIVLGSNATIFANFRPTLTLTVNSNGSGAVSPTSEDGIVAGAPVSVTATAADGHRFINWTVTGGQAWFDDVNAEKTTVSMSTDAAITANFRENVSAKMPTVLVKFGIGGQNLDYERKTDGNGISLRDQDRTVTSGTAMGIDVITIGKMGLAISTGVNIVIGSDEGVSIDPSLGIGYVNYKQHYLGAFLNLIANSYIIPDNLYVNPYNNQRGDIFIAPTFLSGYDFGGVSLGGHLSYMYGIMSSVSGFKFSVGAGVNLAK